MKNKKILFLNFYFLIFYFFLNISVYLTISKLLDNLFVKMLFFVSLVALYLMPIITSVYKKKFLALIGYLWMGFVIYFLGLSIVFKTFDVFFNVAFNNQIWISIIISGALTFFSHKNIGKLKVKTYKIENPKIKRNLSITLLSDIHWGFFTRAEEFKKIIDMNNSQRPNIVILAGDIIDAQGEIDSDFLKCLSSLKSDIINIAVLGNHEGFFELAQIKKVFAESNVKVLDNETLELFNWLQITGVGFGQEIMDSTLDKLDCDKFTILITHKAITEQRVLKYFDLQLSGHTHAGQFFPLTIFTKIIFRYNYGMYNLKDNKKIYVSSGTGTWLPPLRFLTNPEIVLFKLSPREV